LAVCQADWFDDNSNYTCLGSTMRVRKAWTKCTSYERWRYVHLVYKMKHYQDVWRTGYGAESLYDTFVMIHGGGANYGWHYTSIFPYAHKAFCYMYESALRFIGITQGASLGITQEEMCDFGLIFWDWETLYDSRKVKVAPYPILQSSIFDPTLMGSINVNPTTYKVTDGLFFGNGTGPTGNFVMYKSVCSVGATQTSPATGCDYDMKRTLGPSFAPGLDPTQVMQTIYSLPAYTQFCPWICAQAHNGIHGFIGMSMAAVMQSPDDPFFFLHHCNVDRFLHLWLNCQGYDQTPKESITPTQFCNINPTTGSAARDGSGNVMVFSLDSPITYYMSPSRPPKYLPVASFPTVRQLWTLGTDNSSDWNGLRYRYYLDDLALNCISSVCVPNNTWSYFNYVPSSKKRSEEQTIEEPNETEKLYQNITDTFTYLTEEKGMTPQAALDKMAWDNCMASPNIVTEESKKFLKGMGLTPMDTKRICDDPANLRLSEEELANWRSVDHMSHHM